MIDLDFPYETAMARVDKELRELEGRLWANYAKVSGAAEEEDIESRINTLFERGKLGKEDKEMLFLLSEIVFGTFWHTTDNWKSLEGRMQQEDRIFYSTLILEQAKMAYTVKGAAQPGYRYGYAWIVEKYDQGVLKDYVSKELLKEAVNRGFWEYANWHFTAEEEMVNLNGSIYGRYEALMKYSELLDFTRTDEFWQKPLSGRTGWTTPGYRNTVQKVMSSLKDETAVKLVAPIVDYIFGETLRSENEEFDTKRIEKTIADRLKPYIRYLKIEPVQERLRSGAIVNLDCLYGEYGYEALRDLQIRLGYLNLDDKAKAKFVSSHITLPSYENAPIENLIDIGFPVKLLTEEKRKELEGVLLKHITAMAKFVINPGAKTEGLEDSMAKVTLGSVSGKIIPITIAQNAMELGLLSQINGKSFIEGMLKAHIESNRLPSKDAVAAWKATEIKIEVDPKLYQKFLRKTDSDVRASKKRSTVGILRAEQVKERESARIMQARTFS